MWDDACVVQNEPAPTEPNNQPTKDMKTKTTFLTMALAAGIAAPTLMADEPVNLAAYPAAVQATIQSHLQGGKLDEIERYQFDGRTLYKVEIDLKGDRDLDLYIDGKGGLVKTKEDISFKDLPAAVKDATRQLSPRGKVDDVERITAAGGTTYRVEIEDELEVEFAADGRILQKKADL